MSRKGEEKICQYKKAFKEADKSGDGLLDIQEFNAMLRKHGSNLSDKQVAETFLFFSDKDKDKRTISFDEFCEGLERLKEFQRKLQQLFCQLDADKSGFLDRNELRTLMDMANMKLTEAELTEVLQRADKNKDNKISYEEFVEAVC